mmetsp:Transcript_7523/g.8493  ORF Transcript_7523/g.8493 Transcript_7523/m.8493 type:complete len:300 (+) Transcript_7523:33-932(+)
MSGSQLGTYQPPSFSDAPAKKEPAKGKEFNLLDMDFEDIGLDQSQPHSLLDASESDIKEDVPIVDVSEQKMDALWNNIKAKEYQMGNDEEINANSGEGSNSNAAEPQPSWTRYLSLEYYKQYFEVTTEDVVIRMRNSCLPFLYQGSIFENGKIDLYGPIWVIITLNITITIFGNMARYIKFETHNDEKQYISDITNLTRNVPLVTVYFILMPVFLSCFIKMSGSRHISKITFTIMAIYGYSFTSFIPAAILYIIPFTGFKWLILLVAACLSLLFLSKELLPMVRMNLDDSKIKLAAGIM